MPREDRICIALFDKLYHFIKHWPTWNFGRLFFNKFKGDVQIFSLGIVSQFGELSVNRKNLLVLDISGLASIQKEFFIFHIIIHSDKNSFCIKQILLVKIASDFEPPPRRKISARKRAKNSEFVWENGGKSVGRASRVPPFGFEKAVEFCFGVFIVPSSNLLSKSLMCHAPRAWWLETKSYARIVPPLPRFTRQPQKEKMFLAFRICARPIFSKNGKDIFLFGVLPSKYSGRWRNNADEVLAKLFFGERICQNFGSFVFEFGCRKWKRRGLGRNFPFAPLFSFGEFRAGRILLRLIVSIMFVIIELHQLR